MLKSVSAFIHTSAEILFPGVVRRRKWPCRESRFNETYFGMLVEAALVLDFACGAFGAVAAGVAAFLARVLVAAVLAFGVLPWADNTC